MGAKKKSTVKGKSSLAKKAKGVVSSLAGKMGLSKGSKGGARRKSRLTPEKLARQILILRLKKRLYKMKYGGR